jgi:hypothetical protein
METECSVVLILDFIFSKTAKYIQDIRLSSLECLFKGRVTEVYKKFC